MSQRGSSEHDGAAVLVGDACLFTGASFCILAVAGGPLALLVGPALAWVLHGRRLDSHSIISGLIGLVVGIAVVGGLLAGMPAVIRALGPAVPVAEDYTAPLALLAIVGLLFVLAVAALVVGAVRDLLPANRAHVRLDVARLLAAAAVAAFGTVVGVMQWTHPASQIGDAGVFALAAAAVGAVTMAAGHAIASHPSNGRHDIGPASRA